MESDSSETEIFQAEPELQHISHDNSNTIKDIHNKGLASFY